ncbi:retrovirus-related pol polyprotein from transposon TNT 1-94, partial [Tanacetum coccineum]
MVATRTNEIEPQMDETYLVTDVTRLKNGEGASRFSRLGKLDFPKFYGDDVKGWMYRVKQFFVVDDAILKRFREINEDLMAELKNLRYKTTMKQYQSDFETLLNQVEITEAQSVSMYIVGLPTMEMHVRIFKPRTLADAFSLSNFQETVMLLNKKWLTQKEIGDRRAKGLYFYCDQKFMPGHKCSGHMFVLEVSLDEEVEDSNDVTIGEEGGNSEENGELLLSECYASPQISLNAISGTPTFNTMRMKALVAKQLLHLLMDTGSTHNFLDLFTVTFYIF